MRISDWISDVCSSDLHTLGECTRSLVRSGSLAQALVIARGAGAESVLGAGFERVSGVVEVVTDVIVVVVTSDHVVEEEDHERAGVEVLSVGEDVVDRKQAGVSLGVESVKHEGGQQLGRASCRERGCQYGWSRGGE